MTHDPVITEAQIEAGTKAFLHFAHSGAVIGSEVIAAIYLAMHRTKPVVDVEGMVERVAFIAKALKRVDMSQAARLAVIASAIEALNSQGGV